MPLTDSAVLAFIRRIPAGMLESTYARLVDITQPPIVEPILVAEMRGVKVDACLQNAQRNVSFVVRTSSEVIYAGLTVITNGVHYPGQVLLSMLAEATSVHGKALIRAEQPETMRRGGPQRRFMVTWMDQRGTQVFHLLLVKENDMTFEYSYPSPTDPGSTRLLMSYEDDSLRVGEEKWYSNEGPLGSSNGPVGFARLLRFG
ncbi:hypothetical protein EXIGLDRAFT_724372 [Exidia glandulosa HHB12029]|uniref:Uncharacterized protein n=1 Tax=Exidia glandulosa HHB12029 TaxID=1314781 RepID=A0A165EGB1_EXIGL|nr:hypothetical protein EXIGLDRAFT_724372 [Exidia glandulosa HHB12029]